MGGSKGGQMVVSWILSAARAEEIWKVWIASENAGGHQDRWCGRGSMGRRVERHNTSKSTGLNRRQVHAQRNKPAWDNGKT